MNTQLRALNSPFVVLPMAAFAAAGVAPGGTVAMVEELQFAADSMAVAGECTGWKPSEVQQ